MRMPVTYDEMRDAIQALHTAVPRFGLTADSLPQVVHVYRDTLDSFDGEVVRGAGKMLLRSQAKFPSPSVWRDACTEWLRHHRIVLGREPETDAAGRDIVCRTCRSVPRWAILRMVSHVGSLPQTAPKFGCDHLGEVMRCLAVCDPDRHHTPHGLTPLPDTFLRWA